jgi:integral membrane protein
MKATDLSAINILRKIGLLEGFSWLLLLAVAMPLKYLAGEPMPVKIVGWLHGLLFMLYIAQLIRVHFIYKWPVKLSFMGLIASFLPFGTWFFDARLKKQQRNITGIPY